MKIIIEVTSQNKLYNELSSESPKFRRWFRKLGTFYNIKTVGVSEYLSDVILITSFCSRTDIWKRSFTPYTILEWNKLQSWP